MRNLITKAIFLPFIFTIFLTQHPLKAQCLDDEVIFEFTGDLQEWVVPPMVHQIRIMAKGGNGGQGMDNGGFGALIETLIPVTPGQVLTILVGGRGMDGDFSSTTVLGQTINIRRPGGGGGGSFVRDGTNNILIAAAGGGGGGRDASVGTSNAGNHGGINLGTMAPTEPNTTGGMGGMAGGGGNNGGIAGGAGGGGFLFNGMNGPFAAGIIAPTGGQAIMDGGDGGNGFLPIVAPFFSGGDGGYGGGGGGGLNGGGGGGGYNGGGGGASTGVIPNTRHGGGGGGSFVHPSSISFAAGISEDEDGMDGWVTICATQIHAIPTMSQWGMFILFLAFSILGIVFMRHPVNAHRGIGV